MYSRELGFYDGLLGGGVAGVRPMGAGVLAAGRCRGRGRGRGNGGKAGRLRALSLVTRWSWPDGCAPARLLEPGDRDRTPVEDVRDIGPGQPRVSGLERLQPLDRRQRHHAKKDTSTISSQTSNHLND